MIDWIYAAPPLALIALWGLYGALGPYVKKGDRNRHNALLVQSNGDPYPLVQERGEWKLAKIAGVASGLIAWAVCVFLIGDPNFTALMPFIICALGDTIMRTRFLSDSAGHGAEILAAEAAGVEGYRDEEIRRLQYQKNWQKALGFGGASEGAREKISDRLDDTEWLARIVWRLGR